MVWMYLDYYKSLLGEVPSFLKKYLTVPSMERLKGIGYFCGMDRASKEIYNFREPITRYDHSLTVALMTYRLTHDKKATLAGLFHDVGTPCFSHVVDYMNQDFEKQESTEEFTEEILEKDPLLKDYLKEDGLHISDIANFKQYPVVDNERPKLCADRLDGIILTGISWTKDITPEDISEMIRTMQLYQNDEGEPEIGFANPAVGEKVLALSHTIDEYCHSDADNYMMSVLGDITRLAIQDGLFTYHDLYTMSEEEAFQLFHQSSNVEIHYLLNKFYHLPKDRIPEKNIPRIKRRVIHPIVCGRRIYE